MSNVQLPAARWAGPATDRSELGDERLLLLAQEPDEVALVSALTQSAVLHVSDIVYDERARRLVLLLNRYRWENNDQTRVRSALRFESVTAVQRRHWPEHQAESEPAVLELLAFTFDGAVITISFGGGAALRIAVECVDLVLEDISGPWRASREPRYE